MKNKIATLAIKSKINESGEILLDNEIVELDDSVLEYISGGSINVDCTNTGDCTHTTNHGSCSNKTCQPLTEMK
ncbi:MAG TPA: hypothetical protein VIM93_00180 [Kangiella sp.]